MGSVISSISSPSRLGGEGDAGRAWSAQVRAGGAPGPRNWQEVPVSLASKGLGSRRGARVARGPPSTGRRERVLPARAGRRPGTTQTRRRALRDLSKRRRGLSTARHSRPLQGRGAGGRPILRAPRGEAAAGSGAFSAGL